MEIGKLIRAQRKKRGITLVELAEVTNISVSFLSQIETGKCEPSINSLKKIADGLHISLNDLFGEIEQDDRMFVKKDERARLFSAGESGVTIELLPPYNRDCIIEPCIHVVEPSCKSGRQEYTHSGQELFFVLKGSFKLMIDDKSYNMEEGDSYYLKNCELRHLFINQSSNVKSEMLCITILPYEYGKE